MSKRLLAVFGLSLSIVLMGCQGDNLSRLPVEGRFNPETLEFGEVPIGLAPSASVALVNDGAVNLTVDDVLIPPDFEIPEIQDVLAGTEVAPNQQVEFDVRFAPSRQGGRSGTLSVVSGDQTIDLQLSGSGVFRPFATCSPQSVNFGGVTRGRSAMATVTCSATGGDVTLEGAEVIEGEEDGFTLPDDFTPITLAAGESVSIELRFGADGLPGFRDGRLTLQNNGIETSIALRAEVLIPPPDENEVSTTLTWDTTGTDVDLHILREGGSLFALDGSDVYYFVPNPDWGEPGVTEDNPFFDIDDQDGFGPETINLRVAPPGRYEVWAHYFSGPADRATRATVEIFLDGVSVSTDTQRLECTQAWRVGFIDWQGDGGTFTPDDRVMTLAQGRCIRTQS